MTADTEWLDDQLDEQLVRLGEHRERRAGLGSVGHAARPVERRVSRLSLLAAAAAALALFGSGAYLAVRSGEGTGVVDTVGESGLAAEAELGLEANPSYPDGGDVEGGLESARGRMLDDDLEESVATTTTAVGRTGDTQVAGTADDERADQSPAVSSPTSSDDSDQVIAGDTDTDPALEDVAEAGAALSETSAAMVDLTAALAGSGAASAGQSPDAVGDRRSQEQLANVIAAGAVDRRQNCTATELSADLTISIHFVNCPSDDGRQVNGTLVASVKRWIPFELAVLVNEMTIGEDRLWLNATIAFPRIGRGGAVIPVLSGEIATEKAGVVTHIEGTARFLQGRTVFNGQLGHVTGSEVTTAQSVFYRPGETVVAASFVDLSVTAGSCLPSSGTADYQVFTVAGVRGGRAQTDDVELVDLHEEISAHVAYLATTPIDGGVDLRVGGQRMNHRLLSSLC